MPIVAAIIVITQIIVEYARISTCIIEMMRKITFSRARLFKWVRIVALEGCAVYKLMMIVMMMMMMMLGDDNDDDAGW
jgi:hypothetical protein